jgi:hypothetical protein
LSPGSRRGAKNWRSLPFQSIQSNNHIAQWTEKIIVTQ